jgi:hypothetical protein
MKSAFPQGVATQSQIEDNTEHFGITWSIVRKRAAACQCISANGLQ